MLFLHVLCDTSVCINTATLLPLSLCRYRFTEIRYHRPEEMHKGRLVPARVETVVIFLPDVWSCCPTRLEWEQIQTAYKRQLLDKLAEETKEDTQAQTPYITIATLFHMYPIYVCESVNVLIWHPHIVSLISLHTLGQTHGFLWNL